MIGLVAGVYYLFDTEDERIQDVLSGDYSDQEREKLLAELSDEQLGEVVSIMTTAMRSEI